MTGGGQDFVRAFAEPVYGIPPEQVIGTCSARSAFSTGPEGNPFSSEEPKLLLNDDSAGKPEGIHLVIGRRPTSPSAIRPATERCSNMRRPAPARGSPMLVLHDDSAREYAYGPAQCLPETKIGPFSSELYDLANKNRWIVVSMKNDWKRIFAFD